MTFQTVEQLQTSVAELTAENQRLREVMIVLVHDASEYYEAWLTDGCDQKDALRFVGHVSSTIFNTLRPKEGE